MGFLRRIAGFLGLSREEEAVEPSHPKGDDGCGDEGGGRTGVGAPRGGAGRGFAVQVPVAVDRPSLGPVLVPCDPGEGGVQVPSFSLYSNPAIRSTKKGFRWYTRRLRIDEDGDVADEFLSEATTETLPTENQITPPKFQVKYNTRPTALAMRKQVTVADGNLRQSIEYQGKLQWV